MLHKKEIKKNRAETWDPPKVPEAADMHRPNTIKATTTAKILIPVPMPSTNRATR
jgi:hypothetical protein